MFSLTFPPPILLSPDCRIPGIETTDFTRYIQEKSQPTGIFLKLGQYKIIFIVAKNIGKKKLTKMSKTLSNSVSGFIYHIKIRPHTLLTICSNYLRTVHAPSSLG